MKLVQILARELVEWNKTTEFYCQDDCGQVYPWIGKPEICNGEWGGGVMKAQVDESTKAESVFCRIASDQSTAIVTRADWEAERARIAGIEVAQKASAANKDGWIRHRGGKCPVDAGTLVDVKYRNGFINLHVPALVEYSKDGSLTDCQASAWGHIQSPHDIMAYRLHKPAEQVVTQQEMTEAFAQAEPQGVFLPGKIDQIDGPIKWRDRITEIDATTSALAAERADLVQKLASEGFALIGRINDLLTDAAQKHEDMGDPKNWIEGDLIESVSDDRVDISIGVKYQLVDDCDGRLVRFRDNDGDIRDRPADLYKFHSRPSA